MPPLWLLFALCSIVRIRRRLPMSVRLGFVVEALYSLIAMSPPLRVK